MPPRLNDHNDDKYDNDDNYNNDDNEYFDRIKTSKIAKLLLSMFVLLSFRVLAKFWSCNENQVDVTRFSLNFSGFFPQEFCNFLFIQVLYIFPFSHVRELNNNKLKELTADSFKQLPKLKTL